MNKQLVVFIVMLLMAIGFIYHYYQTTNVTVNGTTWSKVEKHGSITTFKYSTTYTKIVHTTTNKFGQTTYYETYIATYTKPADYSTISIQLFALKKASPADYIYHIDLYYDKGNSSIKVYREYQNPTVYAGTTTYPGGFFETYYLTKSGDYYYGTLVGYDAQTTTFDYSAASSLYNKYLDLVGQVWSQLNFAPIMTFTLDGATYEVSIPPQYYSKIFSDVDVPINGIMILPTDRTVYFGNNTYAVYPAGTYAGTYWFKIYGNSQTVITTTLTSSRSEG